MKERILVQRYEDQNTVSQKSPIEFIRNNQDTTFLLKVVHTSFKVGLYKKIRESESEIVCSVSEKLYINR